MNTELRILILEDVPEDAELIKRVLSKAKLQFTSRIADNKNDFLKELKEFLPDIILSDYTMPRFTGLEALEMVKEIAPSTPFIIVTGSINEETAVECMKAGAVDYVLKDRLIKIATAIKSALENKRIRDEKTRVEKALAASAREWQTTFDAINDAVCLLDSEGSVLRCNTAMKNLVGKPFGEIIGKGCSGLFRNAASSDKLCLFARMHESHRRETTLVELNNRWFNILLDPIMDETGALIGGVQIVSDITERKRAEKALQFTRFSLDNATDSLVSTDINGRFIDVNDAFCRSVGYSREELLSMSVHDIDPNHPAETWPEFWEKLKQSGSLKFESRHRTKEGKVFPVEITASFFEYHGEEYHCGFARDITERKQMEEILKESEARYRTLFEKATEGILIADIETKKFRYANPAICHMLGYSEKELLQMCVSDIHPKESLMHVIAEFEAQARGEKTLAPNLPCLRKDGKILYTNITTTSVVINGIECAVGFFTDISELKRVEDALRESEEIFKLFMEHSPIYVFIKDEKIRSIKLSRNYEKMLGKPLHEILGKSMDELFPSELAKSMIEDDLRVLRDGRPIEVIEELDGRVYETLKFPIIKEGRPSLIAGFTVDITERRRVEEERIRLETAIKHLDEYIIITDKEGTIQYVNPAFLKITGYTREEAIGKNPRILKSGKHDEVFYKTLWDTLLSGKTWKGHLINRKKDGSFYEEEASISSIKDNAGNITNFVAVKRDVTNEVIMEQRLRESQKMEAIGTLAGGIAHDFNNILAAIIGYTELSFDTVPEGSQVHSDLTKIFQAGYRARDLVNQILTFSRQREQEKRPIKIAPIVKESLKLLRASLPSTVEIRQNIEPEPGMVKADPTQIHQVIMNLCTNAGHSMREKGGILEVSLTSKELDSEFCLRHQGLIPGLYLELKVSDTGHGIAPDILPRIFEPYFTTKEKSGGTGLGLSVVHGIVTGCGGTVTVYSEQGKGTTFKVYLPITTEEAVAEIEKPPSVAKGHERILLIDDEPDIIDVGKRILEQLGYTVTTNSSSMDALELFQKDPHQFDLVITDMTMPFMTGDELAEEFMHIRQDIPIIICTGYSEKLTEEKALSIGIRAYLGKPLLKSEIAETVRRVLDQKSEDA